MINDFPTLYAFTDSNGRLTAQALEWLRDLVDGNRAQDETNTGTAGSLGSLDTRVASLESGWVTITTDLAALTVRVTAAEAAIASQRSDYNALVTKLKADDTLDDGWTP